MKPMVTINFVAKLFIFLMFISFNTYICFYAKDKTAGIVTACIGIFLMLVVAATGFFLEKKKRDPDIPSGSQKGEGT
ncbi:hypothetical protein AS888_05340 [Peribacillus simplex]|uniref:Uncharacterized protein n=1 Tax=Peribacillus simplex TaxID=1478 RepID=A0A109N1S9_9BACI|nr:hypothetical protein [Peribacillus simplex]KWW21911.1 hypothetical protein AS888_05340 [Peribacillus simplex]